MGKARGNNESFEKHVQNKINELYGLNSKLGQSDAFLNQTNTQIHTDLHNYFKLGKPNIIGAPTGYNEARVKIVNGVIDTGQTSGKNAAVIVVESETGIIDELSEIHSAYLPYQMIIITAKAGHTITLVSGSTIDLAEPITFTNQNYPVLINDKLDSKWKLYGLGGVGGGGPATDPILLPQLSNVPTPANQTAPTLTPLSWSTNVIHVTVDRDLAFSFSDFPITNKYEGLLVILDIDGTGGYASPEWPGELVNPPIIPTTPNTRFSVLLYTINNGALVTNGTSVGSSSGGVTKLSQLEIDVTKDWQIKSITNQAATQYVDTGGMVRGSISGDAAATALRLATALGEKFVISDVITDIAEFDDATGLKILGDHLINLNNNIMNTIKELQFANGNAHAPSNELSIAFDNNDDALKYAVPLTTDSHRFYADTDLIAAISRVGSNEGLLSIQAVVAASIQATETLLLSTFTNTTPTNGEIWRDLATGEFKFQQNGITEELGGSGEFFGPWTADHNAGDFALNDVSSLQISDSIGGIHALLQGLVTPETRLTLTAGEKFSIFDNITSILEIDDTTGLKMLGTHVINLGNNIINTIKELQLDNSNVFSPTIQNVIGFDGFTNALKYNVALTTDIHSFHAAGELLAGISRIGSNSGLLSIDAVVAEILEATDKVSIQNGFAIENTDSTTTEFIIPNNEVLKFIDGSTEVGKYDSDIENWVFNPANDVQLSPTLDVDLTPQRNIVMNPVGEINVFEDLNMQGTSVVDHSATASTPVGSAIGAIQCRVNGVIRLIKFYST